MTGRAPLARSALSAGRRLAPLYAANAAAAALGEAAGLPLAWIIAPMLVTFGLGLMRRAPEVPDATRPFGQLVVASSIGMAFTPAALAVVAERAGVILASAVLTLGLGLVFAKFLGRATRTDAATAFLAVIPNGPVEMARLARLHDCDVGLVIFSQTLRICLVVLLVPFAVYAIKNGLPDTRAVMPAGAPGPIPAWMLLALTLAASYGAGLVAKRMRVPNAYFLGPMTLTAIAAALTVPLVPWPHAMMALAQLVLGTWLGAAIGPDLLRKARKMIWACLLTTIGFLAACIVLGLSLAALSGSEPGTLVLGAAPGGVTEMTLTARAMSLDVATITAFHVVRIALLMPNIPWMLGAVRRRSDKLNGRPPP